MACLNEMSFGTSSACTSSCLNLTAASLWSNTRQEHTHSHTRSTTNADPFSPRQPPWTTTLCTSQKTRGSLLQQQIWCLRGHVRSWTNCFTFAPISPSHWFISLLSFSKLRNNSGRHDERLVLLICVCSHVMHVCAIYVVLVTYLFAVGSSQVARVVL